MATCFVDIQVHWPFICMVICEWYESLIIKPGSPMSLVKLSISACLFLFWYKAKPHNKFPNGCCHSGSNQQNPLLNCNAMKLWNMPTFGKCQGGQLAPWSNLIIYARLRVIELMDVWLWHPTWVPFMEMSKLLGFLVVGQYCHFRIKSRSEVGCQCGMCMTLNRNTDLHMICS